MLINFYCLTIDMVFFVHNCHPLSIAMSSKSLAVNQ
jgi:hypothetical protein